MMYHVAKVTQTPINKRPVTTTWPKKPIMQSPHHRVEHYKRSGDRRQTHVELQDVGASALAGSHLFYADDVDGGSTGSVTSGHVRV